MPSVAILGGGISGLSLGWKLAQAEIPVTIVESESFSGGLAGSIRDGGHILDFGPHSFFSEDQEVAQTVSDLMGPGGIVSIPRQVKFYYRGRFLDYPFNAFSILSQMGPEECLQTLASFIGHRLFKRGKEVPVEDLSVEDWASSHFGPRLYEAFFKPYTEQFWKIPCSELSARTIPSHTRLSFLKTLKHLLRKRLSRKTLMQLEREKLPTGYPRHGYGEIAERIAEEFVSLGGILKLNARVCGVNPGESFSLEYLDENVGRSLHHADTVISTLPLPVLIEMLQPAAPAEVQKSAKELHYRPILFLGLVTSSNVSLNSSYIYVLDRPYNRITDMNRFSPETSPEGENIIGLEIPCRFDDEVWHKSPEALLEDCIGTLEKDGILKREDVRKTFLAKSRYAYPVYRKNYAAHLRTVLGFVSSIPNLHTLGRSGEFRYMDADQCMRRSFDLSKKLVQNQGAVLAGAAAAN